MKRAIFNSKMTNNKKRPERSVDRDIEIIKKELESSGNWPEKADELWLHLDQNDLDDPKQGDEIMFSIVINDAMDGVDISERYPEFYRRMLQNPTLFQAFLEAIEVLEANYAGELESVPAFEVTIPKKRPKDAGPIVESLGSGAWVARWWQGIDQLISIFRNFSSMPQPGFRSGWGMLEESATSLIRSEVTVENTNLGVQLTAAWTDDPDSMHLQLMVALLDEDEDSAAFRVSSLMAGIHWGKYHQRSAVNEYGKAVFPPLPLATITDDTGQEIIEDLQLMLHPID